MDDHAESRGNTPRSPGLIRVLLSSTGLFLISLILIVAGVTINYFFGLRGTMHVRQGEEQNAVQFSDGPVERSSLYDPGFSLTLDSLYIGEHTPVYEVILWKQDSSPARLIAEGLPPQRVDLARHDLVPMKIRKIPGTDFRYRLRNLYPNFEFTYTYPDQIDTIEPGAPAIVVELKTVVGEEILTLRTDIPSRDRFADVIGLGAALQFFWEPPVHIPDPASTVQDSVGNTIVLSGKERKVYFNFQDSTWILPMEKDVYYQIPGRSGTGFTVLHICPDVNQLRAIPSTKDDEFLNPVAQVEIWKTGEGYREAYLYPESLVRKSGDFQVPGIPVTLSLDIDRGYERAFYRAKVSISKGDQGLRMHKELTSTEGISVNSYRVSIHDVNPLRKDELMLRIVRRPGTPFMFLGSGILVLAIGLLILKKKAVPGKEGQ